MSRIDKTLVLFSTLSFAGALMLQIAWIAKVYGAESLGMFALTTGAMAPALAFLSSSQRFLILTKEVVQIHVQLAIRLIAITVTWLACLVFFTMRRDSLSHLGPLVVLIGLNKTVETLLEIALWNNQKQERAGSFLFCTCARFGPTLVAVLSAFLFDFDLTSFLVTLLVASIFLSAPALWSGERSHYREKMGLAGIASAAFYLIPVGLAAGLESWTVIWPRFNIERVGQLQDVGRFLLFTQIAIIFGLFASSNLQADMPYLSKCALANDKKALLARSLKSLKFISLIMVLGALTGSLIPAALTERIFGTWIEFSASDFLLISGTAWVWYSGGYIANVLAICKGRHWLIMNSIMMALSVLLVAQIANASGLAPYNVAIVALVVSFALRLVVSTGMVVLWIKNDS
jgi:hypothetical protein